jgi:hypothetical protein
MIQNLAAQSRDDCRRFDHWKSGIGIEEPSTRSEREVRSAIFCEDDAVQSTGKEKMSIRGRNRAQNRKMSVSEVKYHFSQVNWMTIRFSLVVVKTWDLWR